MGKHVELRVSEVIDTEWIGYGKKDRYGYYINHKYKHSLTKYFTPDKDNTYFLVFNKQGNLEQYKYFLKLAKEQKWKILFDSPYAINRNYNDFDPRNKLVIFEVE